MKSSNLSRALAAACASLLAVFALAGCSATVVLEPADDANNPKCAEVSVRLPSEIEQFGKRSTNAQATAAWGNPTAIVLRCGLPEVEVSTLTCVSSSDIDWLVDPSKAPSYRFITFGRNPAVEVIVDSTKVSGAAALDAVAAAVSQIEPTRACTAG